jgi:hypothetical protein
VLDCANTERGNKVGTTRAWDQLASGSGRAARVGRVEERTHGEVIQISHYSKPLTTKALDDTSDDVSGKIGCQSRPKPGAARPHPGVAGRRGPGLANASFEFWPIKFVLLESTTYKLRVPEASNRVPKPDRRKITQFRPFSLLNDRPPVCK